MTSRYFILFGLTACAHSNAAAPPPAAVQLPSIAIELIETNDCPQASQQARGAWETYGEAIKLVLPSLDYRTATSADLQARLSAVNELFGRKYGGDDVYELERAYMVPVDSTNAMYGRCMEATELAWRACHPAQREVAHPNVAHDASPLVAMLWRRVWESLPAPWRGQLRLGPAKTDRRAPRFAAIDHTVHSVAPYALEASGLVDLAKGLRALPVIVDKPSALIARDRLLVTSNEAYVRWGKMHPRAWTLLDSMLKNAVLAITGDFVVVRDDDHSALSYSASVIDDALKLAPSDRGYALAVQLVDVVARATPASN